jgi:hypothetical protein
MRGRGGVQSQGLGVQRLAKGTPRSFAQAAQRVVALRQRRQKSSGLMSETPDAVLSALREALARDSIAT